MTLVDSPINSLLRLGTKINNKLSGACLFRAFVQPLLSCVVGNCECIERSISQVLGSSDWHRHSRLPIPSKTKHDRKARMNSSHSTEPNKDASTRMPERKSHAKSRRGCAQCKARRVKCDEVHPYCSNCTRRQEQCSYVNPSANPYTASPGPSGQDQDVYAQQRQLHTKELELMHQYCISTHESISMRNPAAHSALVDMPRLGLEHPFLLDAVFAFTSLHLAYLKPSETRSRLVDASRYQSQALAYCRQQLPILSAAECQAMFHCSAALGMIALAFRIVDPDTQNNLRPTGTCYQLAQLWRGSLLIMKTSANLVDADTFHIIFPPPDYSHLTQEILSPRIEEFLELLRQKAAQYGHSKPATPRRDTDTLTPPDRFRDCEHEPGTEYAASIDSLQEVFAMYQQYPNRVLAWLVLVGAPFMDAVSNQEPLASAIVLLWSVAFRVLDDQWWATGFRRQLVNELVPLVSESDSELAQLAAWVDSQT